MAPSTIIPRFQRALVAAGPGELTLKAIPIPYVDEEGVLVKVAAVALNPSDHKLLDQSTTVGAICGSDYAGTIVKVGKSVCNGLKVGDRVFGAVFGSNPGNPTNGAFCNYVSAQSQLCIRIPHDMTFESATSMGMALKTMALCFRSLGLHTKNINTPHPEKAAKMEYVLVYGGSTATGTIAIQMLKHSGYLPIAICSPRNFELAKSRGAIEAFDYKSPTCKDEVQRFTKGNLAYALDCIGTAASMVLCYGCIGEVGGRYCSLEMYPRRLTIRRRKINPDWVLGWTMFGKQVKLAGAYGRQPSLEDFALVEEWVKMLNELLPTGKIAPHPLEVSTAALTAIPASLKDLRDGKISGKKLVFSI